MEQGVNSQSITELYNKGQEHLDVSKVDEYIEAGECSQTNTELNNKEVQNLGISEVDNNAEYKEGLSSRGSTELYNKVDDDVEYEISLKDVLILVLTGLFLPTWDVASDYILAGTLIYPQYCLEYSWPEYANKFGYDPNKCK